MCFERENNKEMHMRNERERLYESHGARLNKKEEVRKV